MFQKGLIYLLFIVYSLSLVKPLLPVISDTIAHVFWYSQHLATVHFEKGKYHLHLAVMKASNEKQNGQSVPLAKVGFDVSEHLGLLLRHEFSLAQIPILHHSCFSSFFPTVLLANSPHPPELVI
jgi:hypothetical protein